MRTCLRKIEMLAATLATAASVSLALLFTACPNNAGGNTGGGTPASVSYRITFRVDGGHGTLKATAEGIAETDKSPITVEKDKTVTFTAKPEAGYKVDKWTVTPAAALQEGGTAGNPTAKVKITANTKVNVSFTNDLYKVTLESLDSAKKDAVIKAVSEITGRSLEEAKPLVESAPQVFKEDVTAAEADEIIAKIAEAGGTASKSRKTYPVIFSVEGTPANGTLKAEVDGTVIHTTNEVEYDKTVIFTAAPAADYEVGKWKITGGTFEAGTGTNGKLIAKVKITAATTVNVSFTLKTYPVTFSVKGTPANGTLKAEIAGTEIHTNDKAEHGKTVTFTAKPATGYKVDTWTITGGTFEESGTPESTTAKVKITAATTVNVSFTKNGYTVTFDTKGGTPKPPVQIVKYKEKATKPWLEPTKEGHTFEGWYNKAGNALWDFENEVTQNTELYAKWRINTYSVTFGIKGTPPHGTLKAEVGGSAINTTNEVEYGKIVTFTAAPESGYKVDKWTITPASALQEGGIEGNTTAKVKITAVTKVNVSFKAEFTVEMTHGEHGTVSANPAIPASGKVAEGTEITFTAVPSSDYKVDTWTITGGTFEAGTGESGSLTAKVKIIAATTVNVSFTLKTYTVTFGAEGTGGTLKAKTDKITETSASPISVEHGEIVTFTAAPEPGYKVGTWTITGGTFEAGTGTSGSPTAKVKVTAATKVSISFTKNEYTVTFDAKGGTPVPAAQTVKYKEKATEPPALTKEGHTFEGWYNKAGNAPWDFAVNEVTGNTELYAKWRINTYPVTFSVKGTPPNGTLKAEVAGSVIVSGDPVEYGKIVTFTAVPESGYKVDTWTVTPAAALQEGGTTESPTAKVKIAADTEVNVSFIQAIYAIVPFGENGINLRNHLRTATPHTDGIYYIKVTGLKAEDLYGCVDSFRAHASTLGEVLKNNPTKKVALKLGEIHGLTDMSWCFFMCEELIQVHEIPKGVKYMKGCFSGCTNLTQAPDIPSSVTNMKQCFSGCKITQAPVIPNGVTDMSYCFSGCRSLTQAPDIPSSVTDMNNCFHNCASLTQAPVIPNSVTDMSYCFDSCRSLIQAPVISEGVIDMSGCFWACTNLSQAPVIPKTVRYMISCFESCEKITTVTLKCPYNPIQISNPNLWSGQKYAFENAFKNCKGLGNGSIKVPADQLQTYRLNGDKMGLESYFGRYKFVAE